MRVPLGAHFFGDDGSVFELEFAQLQRSLVYESPLKEEHAMGAEPYRYTVGFEADIQAALEKLRAEVFAKGEYRGAEFNPATPQEALEMADADGTASILDIERVADEPDFCCAAPFSPRELRDYFGSERPSAQDVEQSDGFWDDLERGQARYVVLYEGAQPAGIHFVGYSFD
jgi:hypothetical protein